MTDTYLAARIRVPLFSFVVNPRQPTEKQYLDDVEAFVARHGRLPRLGADDERPLATWFYAVYDCRLNVVHETAVRVNTLYASTRGRAHHAVGQTDHRLDELREFVARTGRRPRADSPAARINGGAEHSLALWTRNVRNGKLKVSPEVAAAVTEILERVPLPPRRKRGTS